VTFDLDFDQSPYDIYCVGGTLSLTQSITLTLTLRAIFVFFDKKITYNFFLKTTAWISMQFYKKNPLRFDKLAWSL